MVVFYSFNFKITIQGKILPYTGPGIKNTFFRESSEELEEGVELCSVEQVAIDYYLRNGYTNGEGVNLKPYI